MYIYNELVLKDFTMPQSRLKKKNFSICYHAVCEAVAGGKVRIGWLPTGRNLAGLLTKILDGLKISEIISKILH